MSPVCVNRPDMLDRQDGEKYFKFMCYGSHVLIGQLNAPVKLVPGRFAPNPFASLDVSPPGRFAPVCIAPGRFALTGLFFCPLDVLPPIFNGVRVMVVVVEGGGGFNVESMYITYFAGQHSISQIYDYKPHKLLPPNY